MEIVIQIGNSDNKLTQQEWSSFVYDTDELLRMYGVFHFSGGSPSNAGWQNYCWVIESQKTMSGLEYELSRLAVRYKQDSIALTIGQTVFIKPQ